MNIDDLDDNFGIEAEVGFYEEDDFIYAMVSNKHADATICLYGAHITSYKPARNVEVLWMSPDSMFQFGKAIRGGIPVCFPWFGPHETNESLPQHGFARIMNWEVTKTETLAGGANQITLQLCASDETRKYWDFDFCAEMIFTVGAKLSVTLKVTNPSDKAIKYTSALHSYFSLSGIENITIEGLRDTRYQNQLDGGDYIQKEELLSISEEITRHYYDTKANCVINDSIFNRSIKVEKEGSSNSTVWNPGEETCKQMGDLPDWAYETFVCLETVNKINDGIHLEAGESHETTAIISAE